jgi:hypothetical protein
VKLLIILFRLSCFRNFLKVYSRAWLKVSCLCIKQQVKVNAVSSLYKMKACGGEDVHPHTFLTSALYGRESSATRPCHLQNSMYNCSHDVFRMNKPRRITWAEYVGVGEKRSVCSVCVRKSEGKTSPVRSKRRVKNNMKLGYKDRGW